MNKKLYQIVLSYSITTLGLCVTLCFTSNLYYLIGSAAITSIVNRNIIQSLFSEGMQAGEIETQIDNIIPSLFSEVMQAREIKKQIDNIKEISENIGDLIERFQGKNFQGKKKLQDIKTILDEHNRIITQVYQEKKKNKKNQNVNSAIKSLKDKYQQLVVLKDRLTKLYEEWEKEKLLVQENKNTISAETLDTIYSNQKPQTKSNTEKQDERNKRLECQKIIESLTKKMNLIINDTRYDWNNIRSPIKDLRHELLNETKKNDYNKIDGQALNDTLSKIKSIELRFDEIYKTIPVKSTKPKNKKKSNDDSAYRNALRDNSDINDFQLTYPPKPNRSYFEQLMGIFGY